MSINSVAIIGLGLQGGSIGLAVQEYLPGVATTGYDLSPAHRARAAERGLVGTVCETPAEAVANADLVIFCVPPGVMGMAAEQVRERCPRIASSAMSAPARKRSPGRWAMPCPITW